ncbi:hypothetical protein H9Y04_01100 [Streptomyces sp. TRM66268-LWL]|uniref:Small CPxCG-related zinc finger protein n=1 Tax=Streptomyces polyasparticus TaxID=2767826 RepID=A0ABR7S7Q9_9ACTN|nr:hypothetical protein [Streptomyces polyasparticus]MBC9711169.1 hypothetical protein [Streptomyces polyasparticus]
MDQRPEEADTATGRGQAEDHRMPAGEQLVCARCGITAAPPRPTWTCSVENGSRHYFCDDCSREHLRAIESRLDSSWW